jgi:hypothetical protein
MISVAMIYRLCSPPESERALYLLRDCVGVMERRALLRNLFRLLGLAMAFATPPKVIEGQVSAKLYELTGDWCGHRMVPALLFYKESNVELAVRGAGWSNAQDVTGMATAKQLITPRWSRKCRWTVRGAL